MIYLLQLAQFLFNKIGRYKEEQVILVLTCLICIKEEKISLVHEHLLHVTVSVSTNWNVNFWS